MTAAEEWDTLAAVLDDVEAFLARFVAYPSEAARVAHVLWVVHTHLMPAWESTPRIAFLSPEPGSGKTRALEVTEPLVPRPIHAVNATPAYLFRKVSDQAGAPTILYDEIDTLFGPKAKDNEDVRGMLNAGHRKGAMAGRCVVRGKVVETEELPAYCAVALAGLDDLPDTLMSRSVVIRMRKRSPAEQIKPWRLRVYQAEAAVLFDGIADVADQILPSVNGAWPDLPAGVDDRNADVWEAMLAIADAVGGDWPARARSAAVTLVNDPAGKAPSLGVMLLRDLKVVFGDNTKMATEEVLEALLKLDESPWGNLRGKPLMSRGLSSRLGKYGIHPTQVWIAGANVRGYKAEDLADAWTRYVTPDILGTAAYEPARSARTLGIDPEPSVLADLAAPMAGVPSPFDAVPGHSSNGSNTLNGHMKPECRYCGQPAAGSTDGFCDNLDASHMQAREFAGLAFTPGRPE